MARHFRKSFFRLFILGIMMIAAFTLAGLSSGSPDPQTNDTISLVSDTNASAWDFIGPVTGWDTSQQFVANEIFVQFNPLESLPNAEKKAARDKVHKKVGGTLKKTYNVDGFEDLHLVRIPEGIPLEAIILAYRNDPLVEYAGPNYIISVLDSPPENLTSADGENLSDDPLFAAQWALLNTGQTVNGYPGTPGADINIRDAWNITKGSDEVVIAVIDTGIDLSHPDLSANIWNNAQEIPGNSLDDDGNGYIDDYQGYDFIARDGDPDDAYGHGTLCAGIIGAIGNNGLGISGVNWNTRIMPLKCLDSQGFGTTADAIEAIDYAEQMGAEIISISWGCSESDPVLHEVLSRSPALIVCAAGNSARDIDITPVYPAGYDCDNIISVAASDQDDGLAPFSNWGVTSVDLAAPGVNILTTSPSSTGNLFITSSGTSMAAPHVSGVAGLIKTGYPDATPFEMKTRILSSAEKITALEGKTLTEGRLDAGKALDPAIPIPSPTPTQPTVTPTPTPDPQAGLLSISPVNPDFVEYMLHPYTNGTAEHGLGFIPPPFDSSYLKGMAVDFSGSHTFSYPSYYDLRTIGKVTPVKNQLNCGSCWAFATYGSLESALMPNESWDFSENNLNNLHGFDLEPCDGGNYDMSTAYLTRWSGPVRESDDPYPSSPPSPSPTGLMPAKHVQDVYFIPARGSTSDNDNIKQAITIFGGVYTSFFYDDPYYNASSYNYYYSGTSSTNHAVTIMGWDDNRVVSGAPGPGAFIVKNSWGPSWGEGGYFYISYYDSNVGNYSAVFTVENLTNYDSVDLYDPLGCTSSIGYGTNTGWAANIFTAESYQLLKATGFYALVPNTGYQIYIYKNPTVGPLNSSGYIASKNGTISAPGFHTVVLDSPVPLYPGNRYSIVIRITTPGYTYPIPVEMPVRGYSSEADASSGQSYISNSGTSWTDLTSIVPDFREANVCIKGYLDTSGVPDAAFDASQTSGIAPMIVQFNDISTNSPTAWQWNFGDGALNATVQHPMHTYLTEGNYTVTLTVSNAFGSDTLSQPDFIEVSPCPEPVANFSANQTSGIVPLTVQFTDSSTNTPSSWFWEFGDGYTSGEQNPVHTYTSVGTYTVNLTASNDCGTDMLARADFIEVSPCPVPAANFSANKTSGTVPLTVQFTDSSTNTPTSWFWEFGDGATSEEQNLVHTYTSVGTFTVNLTTTNGCGTDTLSSADFIEVVPCPEPVANFSANQTSGIVPLTVQFTDSSTNTPTSWSWEFGDGFTSEDQNPMHTYTSVGTFTVNLTATNDCGTDTLSSADFIEVSPCPEPIANFSANQTSGTVPLTVQFTDSSTNTPTSWSWEFGDGATSEEQNPVHTYTSVGTFTVNLTATNDCGTDMLSRADFIEGSPCPEPVANFSADQTSGTIPLTVQFTDSSANSPTSWFWEFGDGTSSEDQNPVHVYFSVGTFTVNLTAINDCGSDTLSQPGFIEVYPCPEPIANFSVNRTSGIIALTVQFTDSSTNTPTSWSWEFGDGATSEEQNPVHTYTSVGTYTVNLTATNDCGSDSTSRLAFIRVSPQQIDSISLSKGWNFISIPALLTDSSTTGVLFNDVNTNGFPIWHYNASSHQWTQIAGDTIPPPMEGIWLYSEEFSEDTPISLNFQKGPVAPPVIHLFPGWNTIGIGSRSSQSSSTVLAQLGSRWSTLLIYDNDLQMYHQPAVNGYTEVPMEPGRGYWIYMKEPADFAAMTG